MKQCYWADLLRTLVNEDNMIGLRKKIMVLGDIYIYGVSQARSSVNPVMQAGGNFFQI
jgi:hypothetical protein